MRLSGVAPVAAASLSVVVAAWVAVADARLDERWRDGYGETLVVLGIVVVIAATGCLIATRSAAPRVGWLLIGLSAALPSYGALVAHRLADDGDGPFVARALIAVESFSWLAVYAVVATLAIVFPTGRPATMRWRRVLLVSSLGWAAVAFGIAASPRPATDGTFGDVPGPFRDSLEWLALIVFVPGYVVSIVSLPLALVALVVRFRRSTGVERLQLKWLVLSVALLPASFLTCVAAALLTGSSPDDGGVFGAVIGVLFVGLILGVTASIAVAVTRYGLYRIDWVVSKTLVYGAVTGLLALAWVGVALGLGGTLGGDSAWTASLATAVVALAFLPLRRRVQDAVDRRLSKARFEAVALVRAHEDAVRMGRAEPEQIGVVLRDALRDPTAELLLRLPEDGVLVGCDGSAREVDAAGSVTPVVRDRQDLGLLVHDPRLGDRPELLHAVLGAAGLTIELARLRVELRRQLAEVEDSRRRLVRAGYEERRRLERDLHDGAQQRLVGLGIRLRRIQRSLPREALVLRPALDEAVGEVGNAITDLRTIAAGLRPARLDDGLAAALADLARATPVPVSVDAALERLPETVEAAAYYVACEAVTNAVKHGSPTAIHVAAARHDGVLTLTVVDDGPGGAAVGVGRGGLAGLVDRLQAHGGTLAVESDPSRGTRIEAEIPCAS